MREEIMFDKMPFLDSIQPDKRQQILRYFRTAPDSLADSFIVEELPPNKLFVREDAPLNYVYLIASGVVKATDYRVFGTEFDFTRFDKVYVMGGMEVIMKLTTYRTTLTTVTKSIVVKIPVKPYTDWLCSDVAALHQEAKLMGEYLLEQGRLARAFLFLGGLERLMLLLIRKYEKYEDKGIFHINANRQHLANETGLAIKTINRSLKKLEEEGMVSKSERYVLINHEQYLRMKEWVDELICISDEK